MQSSLIERPDEWVDTQLGEIVPYGKTSKCVRDEVDDDVWVLELEDIEKDSSKILQRVLSASRKFKSTKNRFKKGDVLYGKLRPYLNKVVIADQDGVCTTEIVPLDASPFVDNRYLFYWLKGHEFREFVNEVSYGVNMPRLGTKDAVVAPFVLAPIAEQKAIADKLDTLLAQVENTKARLERIPQILKRFRQSVLAAAVSGKLTEDWRMENPDIPLPKEVSIGEISSLVTKGASPKWQGISYVEDSSQTLFVTSENVGQFGLMLDKPKYVQDAFNQKQARSMLKAEDVLTNIVGASIGRTAVWPHDRLANINQAVCLIRPKTQDCSAQFLCAYLNSPEGLAKLTGNRVDVARANVSLANIKKLTLRLPCMAEQKEIAHRLQQYWVAVEVVETSLSRVLDRVNLITQAILGKAFRGELTEQWRKDNPDLISGPNSAEVLLDRIKVEGGRAKGRAKRARSV